MSSTLYRKYRPQRFADIVGQQPIVRTLTNALTHKRLGQAFLFTGPRGTGKTTLARLLARALNCSNPEGAEPCLACVHCLAMNDGRSMDVIEIDAASHTGVDNIRELRETVRLQPTLGTHKIYIIDEVHMLSTGAWNALLKTLEEPPAHAVFILATTEVHKIPDTILSRCQRFDFTRFPLEQIVTKLTAIAEKEQVMVEREALEMIALSAEGGMRDAESLLAQVIALEDQRVTAAEISAILGLTAHQSIEEFAEALAARDFARCIALLGQITNGGLDIYAFCGSLIAYLRRVLLVSVDATLAKNFRAEYAEAQLATLQRIATQIPAPEAIRLVELFVAARREIRLASLPELPLEIACAKYITPILTTATPIPAAPRPTPPTLTPPLTIPTPNPPRATPAAPPAQPVTPPIPRTAMADDDAPALELPAVERAWPEVVSVAKSTSPAIGFMLSGARVTQVADHTVTIAVKFPIHQGKLTEPKNRLTLEQAFDTILKAKVRLQVVTETAETAPLLSPDSTLLAQTLQALGGQVVG